MIYDFTNEEIAQYAHHRSLMRTYHPDVFAQLPDEIVRLECDEIVRLECDEIVRLECDEIQSRGLESISLKNAGGHKSRKPKYAVVFGIGNGIIEYYKKNAGSLQSLHIVEPDEIEFSLHLAPPCMGDDVAGQARALVRGRKRNKR